MSALYLINGATLRSYFDISVNVKEGRILNIVQEMQDLDLKLFLDHPFYYDLISYITTDVPGTIVFAGNTPQPYIDLINGVVYQDRRGNNIAYEGLIKTLAYFTFARFIESDAYRFTATGPVTKTHDNGDALKQSDITKLVQQQRSKANAHCNEVEKFLRDNRQDFPLWRYNESNTIARQPGPRIRSVDRNKFNYPGFNGSYGYGFNNDFI